MRIEEEIFLIIMGDGKRPLDVRGGGGQRPGVKNLNY